MWIWFIPLIVSYAIFMYIAEHINPFSTFREVTQRRRIKAGRRAGILTLILLFPLIAGAKAWLKHANFSNYRDVEGISSADDYVQEPNPKDGLTADEVSAGAGGLANTDSNPPDEIDPSLVADGPISAELLAGAGRFDVLAEQIPSASSGQSPADTPLPSSASTQKSNESPQWLSLQPSQAYTIQVNASIDRESVELFLSQSKLPEPYAIFSFDRNGRTWYALVHGVFNSARQAEVAIEKLDENASVHTPWVRKIEDVQDILIEEY